ncbi:MAG: VCBS repeat-containing protein [Chloroflexota bacterium]
MKQRSRVGLRVWLTISVLWAAWLLALPAAAQEPAPPSPRPPVRGQEAIAALGERLPAVAQRYGVAEAELRQRLLQDLDVGLDGGDLLLYQCEGLLPPSGAAPASAPSPAPPYPTSQTFLLHSRPGASKVIYLDFTGHVTTGTPWNSYLGISAIVSTPFDIDGSPSTFSELEHERIQRVWQMVAEDYIPYDVDVTTEDPGPEALRKTTYFDALYGQRVVLSPTNYFYPNAGGVAYIGSFNWPSDTPCFCFSGGLGGGDTKPMAECTSHESGHTLGLWHDGIRGGDEYYWGHGTWAPIMGVGYSREVVQWSKGEYANASQTQDDLAIITTFGLSFLNDDYGNTLTTSRPMGAPSFGANGIIATRTDLDLMSFAVGAGNLAITVDPAPVGANLDIRARLLDVGGRVVATSDPTGLAAGLNLSVAEGVYVLEVDGVGAGDPLYTGYSDYGSLGQYTARVIGQRARLGWPALWLNNLGYSPEGGGWTSFDRYPRATGDVNGDGRADMVGFGEGATWVALSTGTGFDAPVAWLSNFGRGPEAGNWTSYNQYPRAVADVNGDGRADLVGFGIPGTLVALSTGTSFAPPTLWLKNLGAPPAAGGWTSFDRYPRLVADVTGDGKADLVGFGNSATWVAVSTGTGFQWPAPWLNNFAYAPEAGGWTSYQKYPRLLADVNGDRKADIVGFGFAGVWVSLAGTGAFGAPQFWLNNLGYSPAGGGWTSYDRYPRALADVNRDGRADVIGFGNTATYVALSTGTGFQAPKALLNNLGYAAAGGGWASQNSHPRFASDVSGDGRADLLGCGNAGVLAGVTAY